MAAKYPEDDPEPFSDIDVEAITAELENITYSDLDIIQPRLRDILFRPAIPTGTVLDTDTYIYYMQRLRQKQQRIEELLDEMKRDLDTLRNTKQKISLDIIWNKHAEEEEPIEDEQGL